MPPCPNVAHANPVPHAMPDPQPADSPPLTPASGQQPIIIGGVSFVAPAPYSEGHVCSAQEARVLNSELAENLRNNFIKRVKAVRGAATSFTPTQLDLLRREFAGYAEQYQFGNGRLTRALGGDPVLRASLEIARSLTTAFWQKKSLVPGENKEAFELDVAKVSQLSHVQEEAQRRVDATHAAASDTFLRDLAADQQQDEVSEADIL